MKHLLDLQKISTVRDKILRYCTFCCLVGCLVDKILFWYFRQLILWRTQISVFVYSLAPICPIPETIFKSDIVQLKTITYHKSYGLKILLSRNQIAKVYLNPPSLSSKLNPKNMSSPPNADAKISCWIPWTYTIKAFNKLILFIFCPFPISTKYVSIIVAKNLTTLSCNN
jgi:hypothetical protein